MMVCPNCRKPVTEHMKFCPKCGQRLIAEEKVTKMDYMEKKVTSWEVKDGRILLRGKDYRAAREIFADYDGRTFKLVTFRGDFPRKHFLYDIDNLEASLACKPFFTRLNEGDVIYLQPIDKHRIGIYGDEPTARVDREVSEHYEAIRMNYCPSCGNKTEEGTRFCAKCGHRLHRDESPSLSVHDREPQPIAAIQEKPSEYMKSMTTTTLLAALLGFFLLYGIGHMYAGRTGRGVAILFGGLALDVGGVLLWFTGEFPWAILMTVMSLAMYIWQIVDARKVCREHNSRISVRYE